MTGEPQPPLPAELAAGREAAFAALYDQYAGRLYAVAQAITGSEADAEDAVHDTLLAVWRSRGALSRVDNLAAYLFVALRRSAVRIVLRRQRAPRVAGGEDCPEPAAAPPRPDQHRREQLERALAQLPQPQRDVVALRLDGELTFAEIGHVLEISPNTAASRYRLALEKLRELLAGLDADD
jgi:RNA polymerase sigma-70 factor (ECF subfamily)